jgi:hypothetical protein
MFTFSVCRDVLYSGRVWRAAGVQAHFGGRHRLDNLEGPPLFEERAAAWNKGNREGDLS